MLRVKKLVSDSFSLWYLKICNLIVKGVEWILILLLTFDWWLLLENWVLKVWHFEHPWDVRLKSFIFTLLNIWLKVFSHPLKLLFDESSFSTLLFRACIFHILYQGLPRINITLISYALLSQPWFVPWSSSFGRSLWIFRSWREVVLFSFLEWLFRLIATLVRTKRCYPWRIVYIWISLSSRVLKDLSLI